MNPKASLMTIDGAALGALAVLTAGVYLGGYAPVQRARAEREALDRQAQTLREDLTTHGEELRTARADVKQLREALATMPNPASAADQPRRVGELAQLATDLGISLQELSPRDARREGKRVLVPVRLTGACGPDELRGLLQSLRARFPDMELTGVDVNRAFDRPQDPAPFSVELLWHTTEAAGGGSGRAGGASDAGARRRTTE
jgi:hypothetical protein